MSDEKSTYKAPEGGVFRKASELHTALQSTTGVRSQSERTVSTSRLTSDVRVRITTRPPNTSSSSRSQ
jgi:hypothetical protein